MSPGATTSSEPCSITSFFATKPLTLAKERKPPMILIDADEGPDPAVSIVNNAAIKNGNRLVDMIFVVDGEGLHVFFYPSLKKKSKKVKRSKHRD